MNLFYIFSSVRFLHLIYLMCGMIFISFPMSMDAKKIKLHLSTPKTSQLHKSHNHSNNKNPELLPVETDSISQYIKFYGFDKNANSVKESFYICNESESYIGEINLSIIYRDLNGRMLHCREERVITDIPPHETRMIIIPALDRQRNLYYHKSKPPRKGGMPFKVEIYLKSVSIVQL